MSDDRSRKGRSVALSGLIGFVLAALLVGMALGVALSFFVIGPMVYGPNMLNQGNNQNTNYQNGYNNPGSTNNPNFNNNQNGNYYNQGLNGNPGFNWQNGNPSPNSQNSNFTNDNGTQTNSGGGGQGMTNSNPSITNPTSQYSGSSEQFALTIPNQNGGQAQGTISADVNCTVQQSGNNIQLDLTIIPTSIPQSLNQAITDNSPVTFNFVGTTSGSQINAQASGIAGSNSNSPNFSLNLSGSITSTAIMMTVSSNPNTQLAISTLQSITLQKN